MSWDVIENVRRSAAKGPAVPLNGVMVSARRLAGGRNGRAPAHYIKLIIGAGLAKKLCLLQERVGIRLAMGGGKWAGRVALSVDNAAGGFQARRDDAGRFILTIGAASAEGLFALEFPAFAAEAEEVTDAPRGTPPMFAFRPSAAMLAVAD